VVNVTSIVNYYTLISFLDNSTYRTSWDNHFINPTITKMIWAVAPSELILFYVTCIRSILEYACPVFHRALPSYLSDDLERLQKLAMKVIYPLLSYTAALKESGLSTLHERREVISLKTFAAIKEDESHKLHELLPKNTTGWYSLRNNRLFNLPKCKTECCKSSFIISHIFSQ